MLAIVLGFTEAGSQSPFQVIYAGRSASDARALADSPPPGIIRTESLSNPSTHHKRHFPGNAAPPVEAHPEPELTEAPPFARKAK